MSSIPGSCCSFHEILQSECGSSRCTEGHVKLSDCNSDISAHLANSHLSKCCDVTEVQLILARAGISRLSATQVAGMTICPRHRHLLGRFWRPPKSCQYPGHTGKVASVAGRHVVNFQMADEIRLLFGKSTAVRSRKCNLFLLPQLHTVIHPVKVRITFLLPKLFCFANAYLTD